MKISLNSVLSEDVGRKDKMLSKLIEMVVLATEKGKVMDIQVGGDRDKDKFTWR